MSFVKYAAGAVICGFTLYNIVDDKTREKFDNGMEKQAIDLVEIKNRTYLVAWEFFGAHQEEVEAETAKLAADIKKRRELLDEKVKANGDTRLPAVDESKKYEKYLAK